MLRWLLIWLALAAPVPALAQGGSLLGLNVGAPPIASGATYTGPGDVVSGATAFYGLRAYSAAYAATPGLSVNVRRASDNVTCDVNVATAGGLGLTTSTCNSSTQGGITPSAFAGTDATASCTLATTTATCTGASSTPHVGSTVAGASLTQPCLITAVGTFTGGAGTFTTSVAGTSTSCGTISVGETFTMTYGLFVPEAYDQSGNGHHATQATAGSQPQLLPNGAGATGTLPCLNYPGGAGQNLAATISGTAFTTLSQVFVARRNNSSGFSGIANLGGQNALSGFGSVANVAVIFAGNIVNETATDNVWHAVQAVFNTTNSILAVDGTISTGLNPGAVPTGLTTIQWGDISNNPVSYTTEMGMWGGILFSTTQIGNVHTNESAYYGTP